VRKVTIAFPSGTPLVSANGREHWRAKAKKIAFLRSAARDILQAQGKLPSLEKARVVGTYYAGNRRIRDSSNQVFWALKAAVDASVDCGVLPDDSDRYVLSTVMERGYPDVPGGQLIIEIIEVADV
jgi:hypothetical protein